MSEPLSLLLLALVVVMAALLARTFISSRIKSVYEEAGSLPYEEATRTDPVFLALSARTARLARWLHAMTTVIALFGGFAVVVLFSLIFKMRH